MSSKRVVHFTGLFAFGLAAAATTGQIVPKSGGDRGLEFPESAGDIEHQPATDLTDALARALAAVRIAELGEQNMAEKARETDFYVQEAYRFDPTSRKAEFIAGRLNILIGRPRDAFRQIEAYTNTPEGSVDWEGFKILADQYLEGEYYVLAATKYSKAADLARNEPSILIGWAKCNLRQGKRPQAIELAERAVQLDPDSAEANEVLANALVAHAQLDRAKQAILTAIERNRFEFRDKPGSLVLLQRLRKQYQTLQSVLLGSIRTDPTVPQLYLELTDAALAYNDASQGILLHELWRRLQEGILATQPRTLPEMIEKYARLAASIKKHQQSIEFLEEYLAKNPLDEAARRATEMLRQDAPAQESASR